MMTTTPRGRRVNARRRAKSSNDGDDGGRGIGDEGDGRRDRCGDRGFDRGDVGGGESVESRSELLFRGRV